MGLQNGGGDRGGEGTGPKGSRSCSKQRGERYVWSRTAHAHSGSATIHATTTRLRHATHAATPDGRRHGRSRRISGLLRNRMPTPSFAEGVAWMPVLFTR